MTIAVDMGRKATKKNKKQKKKQSGGGGGSIWLLYLLFFPDFFENSPWNLNNFVIEGVSGEPYQIRYLDTVYCYSTDTIFFNIWRYCNVALVSSVKASPIGCGYCRIGSKINVTMVKCCGCFNFEL